MKHINNFTEHVNENVINISKKRNFPTYGDTNRLGDKSHKINKQFNDSTDFYYIYDLNKHDIGKYLNTWFKGNHFEGKHNKGESYVQRDEMWTVKKVDEQTSRHLYGRYYNPISINITCPTGAKFTKNEKGEDLYNMGAIIRSIDDSSYSIWFYNIPYNDLEDIRTQIMKWINTQPILNGDEFIKFCISMGANEEDVDYS